MKGQRQVSISVREGRSCTNMSQCSFVPRLLHPIGYVLVQHDQAMLSFVDSQAHTLLAKLHLYVRLGSMVHDSVAQPLHFPVPHP